MKRIGALAIATLTAAFAFSTVSAPTPSFAEGGSHDEVSALLSANPGLSLERAAALFGGQDDLLQLAEHLKQYEPRFSWAKIDPSGDTDAKLAFVGTPSSDTLRRIRGVPLRIEVKTDAEFTAKVVAKKLRDTHAAIEGAKGIAGAAGYLDVETQRLVFAAWQDKSVDVSAARQTISTLTFGDGPKAEVTIVAQSVVRDQVNGGLHLSNGCTSAFNVRDGSGRKGFLTAAHCSNSVSGYTFVREKDAAGVDVQLHRASSVTNKIRYNSGGSTRAITGWSNPQGGAAACNYGRTTGGKCTTIYSNDVCWPGVGCGFYATNDDVTEPGGSGGPWYSGSSAFGVHKGVMFLFGNKSVFTDMYNSLLSMSVALCTTSSC